jgi:glutamine amidotransferase
MGNLGSIKNMLDRIKEKSIITSDPDEINTAEKLILPGVGAFDNGVKKLREFGLLDVLNQKVQTKKTPILGICLGMQLFTKRSEEGALEGLGWIDADTVRFNYSDKERSLRVPHMGWNSIDIKESACPLFREMEGVIKFYFVHSYYVAPNDRFVTAATTTYGKEFTSVICRENIFGVQFHPEKSHRYGMQLLKNFTEL